MTAALLVGSHLLVFLLGLTVRAAACYSHGVATGRRLTLLEHHLSPAVRRTRRHRRALDRPDPLVFRTAVDPHTEP